MMLVAVALAIVLVVGITWVVASRRALVGQLSRMSSSFGHAALEPAATLDEALDRLATSITAANHATAEALSAESLQTAMMAIPHGLLIVDTEARVLFENNSIRSFMQGRHGDAVVADVIEVGLAKALSGERNDELVHLYGPPSRVLRVSMEPVLSDNGGSDSDVVGAVVLVDDVSNQERIETMRRDFVSNISHELRTPVGAMSLLAETLAAETDADVRHDLADRLQREAARMSDTIDDLLELSRIESSAESQHEHLVLQQPVREAVAALQAAADQRSVAIRVVMPDDDVFVRGDQRQLRTAVFNLVDNAIKFVQPEHGLVSVVATVVHDVVLLEVKDNGSGIPRRELDRIFERFYRTDEARSRSTGGTGLGLSIVRHVVANHGGEIAVESVEGEGSTFTLEFPLASDAAGAEEVSS